MKAQSEAAHNALKLLTGSQPGRWIVPGGVASDPGAVDLAPHVEMAASALDRLFKLSDRLVDARGLLARTVEVGVISPSAAQQMALSGPLARASGLRVDVRHDTPYAAYPSLCPELITQEGGDVYARMLVLILEALESLKLIECAAADPPGGPAQSVLPTRLPDGVGVSSVEAPRGALRYQVESVDGELRLLSCRAAPQLDRLLARMMLIGNTLDSAALIALSTDPCGMCLKLTY
jgi:Ni,Fe-hydrogenase III large subunit